MSKRDQRPTGTREWASSSVNCMDGCSHDCRYCYARAKKGQKTGYAWNPLLWTQEEVIPRLANMNFGLRQGTVMFPTTHDITPENKQYTFPVLERLLRAGNKVLIVSKPHLEVIQELCLGILVPYRDKVLFRFTIGSSSDDTLVLWEPRAPLFEERKAALAFAHGAGFATSVSMEPMLDTTEDGIVGTFKALEPFVTDCIWLGKLNKASERLVANGFGDDVTLMAVMADLVESQSDARIRTLYDRMKDEPKVKWKESIKQVVGIESPDEIGLDV